MNASATLLLLIGILVLAAGLLFIGQGWGLIRWPARSFMIDETRWIYYGAAVAAIGLVLIVVSRR
ncbi:MAG TPA: hypothetical protein VN766_20495 [Stellaceae bacterium]|jgi:hypothetical protein|nr:hypothetical protein [Stellaceae bacterium]